MTHPLPPALPTAPPGAAVRRAARLLALVPAVLVTLVTSTAFADAPEQWEDNPAVAPLHAILVLAVFPVGLFVLITLLVYLPSMSKGTTYQPGQVWRGEPTWFGGPRGGVASVDTVEAPAPAVASGATSAERTPGGASGRW